MLRLDTIQAAGGLAIDRSERILFIFKNGRWDLPKGIVDPGGQPDETARREVAEETGVSIDQLRIAFELIPTAHISRYGKRRSLKPTRWFLLLYQGAAETLRPQREEGIESCAWIPIDELEEPLANCPARIRYLVGFWRKARRDAEYRFD